VMAGDTAVPVVARIDTQVEAAYYEHGGILPFVLRQHLATTRR
jgi:aconitate hydratase A / 2-methylisocitrate dehydratase